MGTPIAVTVGFVELHIPTGVGIHAPGVSTPKLAAVREAVMGFIRLVHNANGIRFTKGTQFEQLPSGPIGPKTGEGNNTKVPGAVPKGQLVIAPLQT